MKLISAGAVPMQFGSPAGRAMMVLHAAGRVRPAAWISDSIFKQPKFSNRKFSNGKVASYHQNIRSRLATRCVRVAERTFRPWAW
jgi:hypothetical protein